MNDERQEETRSEEHARHGEERSSRNWASARTIIDALILAGIIAIISSQFVSHDQIADNANKTSVQFATIIAQIASMQNNIADVPALRDRVVRVEAIQLELLRRQAADDALHEKQHENLRGNN